jgi:outer membrane protein TolC
MDRPNDVKNDISLEQALATAMQHRPDLKSSRLGLQNSEIDLSYWKNQMLPDLSLTTSYWSPGVSGTQILYLNDNALTGVVVDVVPGGVTDSFKDAFGFAYQNWSVGLTLDLPLNNIFSRASYAQARVNLDKARLELQNQEQQIFTDIKIAVRDVATYYQQIEAYRAARELAEKQLEAEEEKLRVGLSENYFVLEYQRNLAEARTQELKAVIDYNLALARLSRDMGVSLSEKNIKTARMLER